MHENDLSNLRSLCGGLMSADFTPNDRLKAILQVAYETIGASSIVAYKYNRVTEQLEIFAMPGVREREMMRGPTPETIFTWDKVTPDNPPKGLWLENKQAYDKYIHKISSKKTSKVNKKTGEDFRARELKIYDGKGDFALAKICLYKGIGQTFDKVGQLFFNFHKNDHKQKIFTDNNLRSAIWYVSNIVRELLIDELYHIETIDRQQRDSSCGPLHLLHAVDDKLKFTGSVTFENFQELPLDLRESAFSFLIEKIKFLSQKIKDQIEINDNNKVEMKELVGLFKKLSETLNEKSELSLQKFRKVQIEIGPDKFELETLVDRLGKIIGNLNFSNLLDQENFILLLRELLQEVFAKHLWLMVCRAALSLVETYGGQADIILVLGEAVGRRIVPGHPKPEEAEILWLRSSTITGYCIERGKVFVCNNVSEKGSKYFKDRFKNEPYVKDYKSLMIVPVTIDGEVRALLRLMSTDENCFLDRHTLAMQDIAFVASYALRLLDNRQIHDRISDGLSFFAEGQAIAERPNLEALLKKALRVLGAKDAVFRPIDRSRRGKSPFGKSIYVNISSDSQNAAAKEIEENVRPNGLTFQIYNQAQKAKGDLIYSLHVLAGFTHEKKQEIPEYLLQVFSDKEEAWLNDFYRAPDGYFKGNYDSTQDFPGTQRKIPLGDGTSKTIHSQIGFAIKENNTNKEKNTNVVQGVVWISFKTLHHLGWWERLYVRGLSNYLAQALKATGLTLAIRSFYHMIPGVSWEALMGLEQAEKPFDKSVIGLSPPPNHETAIEQASNVLYMTLRKAGEVKALLKPPAQFAFPSLELREIFHRAWSIATNLGTCSKDFKLLQKKSYKVDEAPSIQVWYGVHVEPGNSVNGALYTAAVNILRNAVDYGKEPFGVWLFSSKKQLKIIFANGGEPPCPDPLVVPTSTVHADVGIHGVGLELVKKILQRENGSIRLYTTQGFQKEYFRSPFQNDYKTFFEVTIPFYGGQ